MVDQLVHIPAFVKIGCAFLGILLLTRVGLVLELSLFVVTLLLTVWIQGDGTLLLPLIRKYMVAENMILLPVLVLLLLFTETLHKTGRMGKTIDALKQLFSNDKVLFASLPALIGLLPMPGGAIVSAPLVDSVDKQRKLPVHQKTAINYWFRHIWEFWWPLYPGVILGISLSGLSAGTYYLVLSPFTVIACLTGYLFILRGIPQSTRSKQVFPPMAQSQNTLLKKNDDSYAPTDITVRTVSVPDILETMVPITILVILSIVGAHIIGLFSPVSKSTGNLLSMFSGLIIAIAVTVSKKPASLIASFKKTISAKTASLLFVLIGVQLFATALKLPANVDGTLNLVGLMREEFHRYNIPLVAIFILLPFISGFVTGISVAFIGISFPLVLQLLSGNQTPGYVIPTICLSYVCGYIGMILSPLHVCFIVSNNYFSARFSDAYRYIIPPAAILFFSALIISGLYFILLR